MRISWNLMSGTMSRLIFDFSHYWNRLLFNIGMYCRNVGIYNTHHKARISKMICIDSNVLVFYNPFKSRMTQYSWNNIWWLKGNETLDMLRHSSFIDLYTLCYATLQYLMKNPFFPAQFIHARQHLWNRFQIL